MLHRSIFGCSQGNYLGLIKIWLSFYSSRVKKFVEAIREQFAKNVG